MGNKIEKEQIMVEKVKNRIYECKFKLEILSGIETASLNPQYVVFNLNKSKLKCKFPDNSCLEFNVFTDVTVVKYKIERLSMKLRVRMSGKDCIWKIEARNIKSIIEWKEALMLSKRPHWILSPVCQNCTRKFSTFLRCHHCRYCGKAVCDQCSKLETKIEIYGYKYPERICNPCARRMVVENEAIMKYSRLRRSNSQTCLVADSREGRVTETVYRRSSSVVYYNLIDYQT
jgi:hypothetical protein